ncbi:MAG: MFS transporter [Gammaproteobacteria bacterium]|nr:MFS transporter [Gammaproteobacteria bacterium]
MDQALPIAFNRRERLTQILSEPRLISVLFLGFASGLPLLLTGSTLQAWYAMSNVNIVTIGLLTLVGQPYVYKFVWAPLLDRYSLPWLGRRRGWMFLLQILLVVGIAVMGLLQPNNEPLGLAFIALIVAFLSASQDISIDAYRTDILQPDERGLGAGLFTMGYRVAMLTGGALVLVMADHIGWKLTYWFMAFLMVLQLVVTYFSKPPVDDVAPPHNLMQAILDPFREFFKHKYAVSILVFIVIYKLGDVFTLILGTTFLIRGVGFSLTDIGLMYKLVGMLGIFIGVLAGGIWMKKITLLRALVVFGIIQTLVNLPFMFLAMSGKNYLLLIVTVFVENFGSGLGSVAFLAFLMSLCDHRYTATHFALFSALAAIGRVFVGPIAGVMVEHLGWVHYFFWAFLLGFPGVIMLSWLKRHSLFKTA